MSAYLAANGVIHTIRRGMLRFAFHLFNSSDDVQRVLGLAREVVAGQTSQGLRDVDR
jgi:cysteine sulfinate desulfinase/cysteine desulfurase-like protein